MPAFPYTVREVILGLTFTGDADERAPSYDGLLAERVCDHLAWPSLDLAPVEWPTNHGLAFLEEAVPAGCPR